MVTICPEVGRENGKNHDKWMMKLNNGLVVRVDDNIKRLECLWL